ncbi:hypothetical protein CJF31_00006553 [Rutstroemia sp. NJR-2017a BVV2]|nr:hypothetical protein CJF31_00006553 [Rutstroemia sp. NJR-2017a BVV2]
MARGIHVPLWDRQGNKQRDMDQPNNPTILRFGNATRDSFGTLIRSFSLLSLPHTKLLPPNPTSTFQETSKTNPTVKMQFKVLALAVAAMASVAVADVTTTVTVYACPTSSGLAASSTGASSGLTVPGAAGSSGYAAPSGTAAATGTVSSATGTTSPIAYATGAASNVQVSAFGMIVAGAVALFI